MLIKEPTISRQEEAVTTTDRVKMETVPLLCSRCALIDTILFVDDYIIGVGVGRWMNVGCVWGGVGGEREVRERERAIRDSRESDNEEEIRQLLNLANLFYLFSIQIILSANHLIKKSD